MHSLEEGIKVEVVKLKHNKEFYELINYKTSSINHLNNSNYNKFKSHTHQLVKFNLSINEPLGGT